MKRHTGRGLHGQVVQEIAQRIVSGTHRPGDLLDPESLGGELGVSRTVVREALRVLGAKGLVDARPHRGTFVQPREEWSLLDPDLMRWQFESSFDTSFQDDLAELRFLIEPRAARLAADRRSGAEVSALEDTLAEMAAAGRNGEAFIAADLRFHRFLLLATHNQLVTRLEVVIETGLLARDRVVHRGDDWSDSTPAHAAVLAAVRDQRPDAAEQAMTALLEVSNRDLATARSRPANLQAPDGTAPDGAALPGRHVAGGRYPDHHTGPGTGRDDQG